MQFEITVCFTQSKDSAQCQGEVNLGCDVAALAPARGSMRLRFRLCVFLWGNISPPWTLSHTVPASGPREAIKEAINSSN